jgi:deoxyribonuclease V
MRLAKFHEWNVTPAEAREIQEKLRKRWEGKDRLPAIRTVAGLDAAFVLTGSQALRKSSQWNVLRDANRAIGGVVVFRFPEMVEIERAYAVLPLRFPYVPGFLSFREIPVLLAALKKLKRMPDLLFCDGQGYAHPRRMGLASHLGIVLDRPTIGCAKSLLIGTHGALPDKAGSWVELLEKSPGGETIGAVLRTRDEVKPIYVSQGHRISLGTAIRLTIAVGDGMKIPRPTRDADRFVSKVKKEMFSPRRPGNLVRV